jgi:hypothetical protein
LYVTAIIAAVLGPVVALALAGLIGNELAARSDRRRKLRDLDLDSLHEFYRLYGEFFALLKLWDSWKRTGYTASADRPAFDRILERATNAEGRVEALLLKVASERKPDAVEQDLLGAYRQGYQTLRESIRDDRSVQWNRSSYEPYAAFKGLACAISQLLSTDREVHWSQIESEEAINAFRQITNNTYELAREGRAGGQTPWVGVAEKQRVVGRPRSV